MKNLARVASVLAGLVASSGAAAVIMVGCSDDDVDVSTADGGEDGAKADVGADGTTTDAPVGDAGKDTSDVFVPPKFDAGPAEKLSYAHQVNRIFCQKLGACCGNPGMFNLEACNTLFDTNGTGFGGIDVIAEVADSGNVTFDPAKAATCFTAVNNLGCGAITAASWEKAKQDCRDALVGTIPTGSTGCRGTGECAPNGHCVITPDAGTCTAPGAVGTPCFVGDYNKSHENCGYLFTGIPRYCDTGFNYPGDNPTNQCADRKALNAPCYDSMECQTSVCDYTSLDAAAPGACSNTLSTILDPGICEFFAIKDAGGGG